MKIPQSFAKNMMSKKLGWVQAQTADTMLYYMALLYSNHAKITFCVISGITHNSIYAIAPPQLLYIVNVPVLLLYELNLGRASALLPAI